MTIHTHTPTPYRQDPNEGLFIFAVSNAKPIAKVTSKGTAAFIVRACNAHDELVKTLGRVEANLTVDTATRLGIYKALKLARGE